MTRYGLIGHEAVRIAELKSKLSEYLRAVESGESITVLDRNRSIAQIVPIRERPGLRIRKPTSSSPPNKVSLPRPAKLNLDVLDLLLEERPKPSMIAYVDASVLLRVALGQPNALQTGARLNRVSSALITTESLRTLDRVRLRAQLSDIEVARRRSTILALLDSLELVEIDSLVLEARCHSRCDRSGRPGCDSLSIGFAFGGMLWESI